MISNIQIVFQYNIEQYINKYIQQELLNKVKYALKIHILKSCR